MEKTKFVCQNCGHQVPKWLGRCPSCEEWNTFQEEKIEKRWYGAEKKSTPYPISEIEITREPRIELGIKEIDRVFGGGIVKGGFYLLGGEPGIGKSTLLLKISGILASFNFKVLYTSAEESVSQVKMRADRMNIDSPFLYVLSESNFLGIKDCVKEIKPDILVVDSIQTIYNPEFSSSPGSLTQVRECGGEILKLTKEENIITFCIGHVTKSGEIAGPKTLEHMVDCVLYLEGEGKEQLRILRNVKNRFGSVSEVGIFEMTGKGLKEVNEPTKVFIAHKKQTPGSVIVPVIEGTRPFLIEIQALVTRSAYSLPKRESTGFDIRRLSLILAVLEKKLKIPFYRYDTYVNVTGGIRIQETSADLGVTLALISSLKNKTIPSNTVIFGEVGLGGEIRPVYNTILRLKEAERIGFKKAVLSAGEKQKRNLSFSEREANEKMSLIFVNDLKEAMDALL